MKRVISLLLTLVLLSGIFLSLPLQAEAATIGSGYCGNNAYWTLSSNGTLTITGTGTMWSYTSSAKAPWAEEYSMRKQITKVVIESGITSIGNYAFYFCGQIRSVQIPSTVTRIGECAFSNCDALQSVVIPYGVKTLPDFAFADCKSMETVSIPSTVTSFGQSVFEGCSSLQYCILPYGITEVSYGTFWGCSAMEYVEIPSTVRSFESFAFHECGNLRDIYFTGTRSQYNAIEVEGNYNESIYYPSVHYSSKAPCVNCSYSNFTNVSSTYHKGTCVNCGNSKNFAHTYSYGSCYYCGYTPAGVRITSQPLSTTVAKGTYATVSVGASGDGLTYKWYYKNKNAQYYSYTSTFTGNTYMAEMNEDRDGRQVYCVVSDKYGNSVQSNSATISMRMNKAKITRQPTSVTVANGGQAVVSFAASGDGLTYKWYYKDRGASGFIHTTTFSGNTYTAQMNGTRNGRQLYCVVTDQYGNSVQTDIVSINMLQNKLTITRQPTSVTVDNGGEVKISFAASGDGLTYKWYYKNKGASAFIHTTTFSGNTYTTQMNAERNGRQVYCVVSDMYGNSVQTDTVSMNMVISGDYTAVSITRQPTSVTVANGQQAEVSFTATGDGLTYKWYYKNAWESKFSYTASFTGNTYSAQMNDTRNGRQLYCIVTDKYGNTAQTNTVSINMQGAQSKVTITRQPTSVTVANGQQAEVSFTATGDGLTYKWYYKNAWESKFSYTASFTGNTYSAQMNDTRNGRQLYCVVTDKYGNTAQTNTVTINMQGAQNKATITRQPTSVTVANGQQAEVSFTATGDGLTYKWYYKNSWESKFSYTASFTGNTYSAQMNDTRNGRQLYCVVTDKYGNTAQTNTVSIKMKEEPQDTSIYSYTISNGKATITACDKSASGKIAIPSRLGGYPVIGIGSEAFDSCENITSITIPETVTYINDVAFRWCSNLTSITIPDSVISVGESAFMDCDKLNYTIYQNGKYLGNAGNPYHVLAGLVSESVSHLDVCSRTKVISGSAVCNATIETASLPEGLVSIGSYAFAHCSYMTSINIPSSVRGIGYEAFLHCSALTSIIIPEGIEKIGGRTFAYCDSMTSVTIPVSITRLGYWAFDGCTDLEYVYYKGTADQWAMITDAGGNECLHNATLRCATPVKITRQPSSVTVANGQTAEVSFTATGDGLTYKWYYKNKDASGFSYTSTFSGNTYSTQMNEARNGRQLYCVVTDQYGNSVQTNTVTISMSGCAVHQYGLWIADGSTMYCVCETCGDVWRKALDREEMGEEMLCGTYALCAMIDESTGIYYDKVDLYEMDLYAILLADADMTGYFWLGSGDDTVDPSPVTFYFIEYDAEGEIYMFDVYMGNSSIVLGVYADKTSASYAHVALIIGDYILMLEPYFG